VITTRYTGGRGRPCKIIDLSFLQEATAPRRLIRLNELARSLGIHKNTLRGYMKRHGIERKYATLSNGELDDFVRDFKRQRPESGLRYAIGFLRRQGHRVQRRRVMMSLRRIDGLGRALRVHSTLQRRKYHVCRPNALWHMDGHHKLIRWGFVIHGIVDGYCRTVCAVTSRY
jgi:hypothetical protein